MNNDILWGVCDCETDSFDYTGQDIKPFIWGILDSNGDYNVFWDTTEFTDYVRKSKIKYLYGHNGGKFDFLFPDVLSQFENGQVMIINSRIAKAKIGKTELRDSFLCLPCPLAKFGEKDDFDYSMLAREKRKLRSTSFKTKIEKYLKQDCVALFNAMERFISLYGFALTQAGASMATWEKMGGEVRRYGQRHDAIFRNYYYGGRTQVFEYANGVSGDFKLYDINSSYPYAMCDYHPVGTDYYESNDYVADNGGASFWHITAISRGALPVRTKRGTTFPNDDIPREFLITGWELQAGLDTKTLDIITARGLIPRRVESMRAYVEKFYNDRIISKANKDILGDMLAKIFMNSLYGRYGMNSEDFMDYKIIQTGTDRGDFHPYMVCGDNEIVQRPAKNKSFYDVALSASVTGFARANLWRALCSCDRPMYCDTDSVLCETFNAPVGDKLGEWKLEAEISEVWISGKKCYVFKQKDGKYKTAHKGISALDVSIDVIKRVAGGESVVIPKSAPNMKLDGTQKFFSRTMKKT